MKELHHKKNILANLSFPAKYFNIPDSEWKDRLVTAVLINIRSPHAHKLYISVQDHLAPNFYMLEIEYFQNNYFFYKENDQAELLDDYEVTPPKLPEPLLLPAPGPLHICDSSSREPASISSSVPGTQNPGSSASLKAKASHSSTKAQSASLSSKHSKKDNTKSSRDPSSTPTPKSSTPTSKHPPSKDLPLPSKNPEPPWDPVLTKSSKTKGVRPQSWVWSHFLLQSNGVSQVCQVRLSDSTTCLKDIPRDKTGSTKAMATYLKWAYGHSSSSSLVL
ncbi:hypothetical protein HMI56_003746 [Coelomomyces lativittatus]|nr:hypothetical protein HMI56_003746 [Coelomomyces lativittatus]